MRQNLVPVLLLVAVALSSSKVLPLLSTSQLRLQLLGIEGQQNDNTFSYSDKTKNVLNNIIYNIPVDTPDYIQGHFDKYQMNYADNNREENNFNIINNKDNRNGDGYRKEQWHNYPRQLDRLHKYINEHKNHDKRNFDPGEIFGNDEDFRNGQYGTLNGLNKELNLYRKWEPQPTYEINKVNNEPNPLLNLKLRLACLNNNLDNIDETFNPITQELGLDQNELKQHYGQIFTNRINPGVNVINNIKEEEIPQENDFKDNTLGENKTIKKRIFSFWSRVQGMGHKGHEILQRRRHMHTFYGTDDGEGNRALTAETRAILMRPPGSPLRWG